ncbi:MAG: cadherin repeat domain-containing protein [Pirellulales bacterium]|nr:cadherin repeat domain-containing protein [Pirellulales bacterium]
MPGASSDRDRPSRTSASPGSSPPVISPVVQIDTSDRVARAAAGRRGGTFSRLAPWLMVGGLAVAGAIVLVVAFSTLGRPGPLALRPIDDVAMDELATLTFTPQLVDPAAGRDGRTFRLIEGPAGAKVNVATGEFSWTPNERQGPGQYRVRLGVAAGDQQAEATFEIAVAEVNRPPKLDPIESVTVAPGAPVHFTATAEDPDDPARELTFRLSGHPPDGARIDAKTGAFTWTPRDAAPGKTYRITVAVSEAGPGGLSARRAFDVRIKDAASTASATPLDSTGQGENEPNATAPEPIASVAAAPAPSPNDEGDRRLLDLLPKNRIFLPKSYPVLREVFAERFAREHEAEIRRGLGGRREAMDRWFAGHKAIQEELYTAINPEHDNISGAVGLFSDLVEKHPDRFPAYADLAIALAVVWDQQGRGIYDYAPHQRRTKSTLPPGRTGAMDNFQYFLDTEGLMQGRAQWMPWEFLTLTVDHCTPLVERQWALEKYLSKRAMFGKCYHDVPYDTVMLETDDATARLNGHPYDLPNICQYGGVCAIQADFASRVGKCLGVPATFVSGQSRGGESHAWVMWVELLGVTPTQINFSLESYGRYRGDRYYIGKLHDPQTNQRITDRQLELRLHAVGLSPQNKRHAALLMKAYPMLRDKAAMDVDARLDFLSRVIQLCPGNEDAWRGIARMSKDGLFTQRYAKVMMNVLDGLFVTFAKFPDFTWEIFDDLVAFQTVPNKRSQLYGQLVALYVQAKRPDLACEAVAQYADELAGQQRYSEAIQALSSTILAFADEGRYVPKMLDRLEAVCPKVRGASEQLLDFYQQLLPKIPKKRGDRPSPFCLKMYRRAIDRFTAGGRPEAAQFWQAELTALDR